MNPLRAFLSVSIWVHLWFLLLSLPLHAASRVERVLPPILDAGVTAGVTNVVTPGEEVLVYLVEENIPPGWSLSQVNERGSVDVELGKIKWGPFFDNRGRIFTYKLTPPEKTHGDFALAGQGSFNGDPVPTTGVIRVRVQPPGGPRADNSVVSKLPDAYIPGRSITLTNQVRLAEETLVYLVEDQVPPGWTVGLINQGGQFDPIQRKIKWGPYSDRVERELRAELSAPAGVTNEVRFGGVGSFNGVEVPIAGAREVQAVISRVVADAPAQFQASEVITVKLLVTPAPNTTVFLVEEKLLPGWTLQAIGNEGLLDTNRQVIKWGPVFATEAVTLSYQIKAPENPSNLAVNFSGTGSFDGLEMPIAGRRQSTAIISRVSREMPEVFLANSTFVVTNHVIPDATVRVYVIEDTVPSGWAIREISDEGSFDATTGKVKWGPFLDGRNRTLHYVIRPPSTVSKAASFAGVGSFDGRNVSITGQQTTRPASAASLHKISRSMPPAVRAGRFVMVTNEVATGPGVSVQSFEEALPAGWKASQISHEGAFDAANRKVKWGPFLDGQSRVLTYQLTPANDAGGPAQIRGVGSFNGDEVAIGGTSSILTIANHPPLARDDLFQRLVGQPLKIAVTELLANDNDPDNDPVRLVEVDPASELNGALKLSGGTISYTPPAGADRADSFFYTVEDGYGGRAKGRAQIAVITNGPSLNRITLETLPNAVVRLRYVGIPGRKYRLEATESLDAAGWVTIGSAIASVRGDFEFDDTEAFSHRSRFYRTVSP